MSVTDEAAARAPRRFAEVADIDEFVATLERFERGEISADDWRRFRLVRGTYGQRQAEDAQMLRIKIPQGVLAAGQLDALADIAERYSRGFGHVTTRQNVQFHFVRLHDVELAMRRAADAGLTTREACGNSVRTITACPYAGVSPDEVFDVTPYAEALTRYLLRHPLSGSLPRKFKIAFEGCASGDHAVTSVNDLGWRAVIGPDGRRGFRVTVGGGTAILCRSGAMLGDFVPASEMFALAEAVLRVFHAHGDFQNKHKNRLKFLIRKMGWPAFQDAVSLAFDQVRSEGTPPLPFDPGRPPEEAAPAWQRPVAPAVAVLRATADTPTHGAGIHPAGIAQPLQDRARWLVTNVHPQKQAGYRLVTITLPLGDVTAGQFRALGAIAAAYGDGSVRTTPDQNFVLRWVPDTVLDALHTSLAAVGLGTAGAATIEDVTSCPGAESCRLAVTQSRGAARLIRAHLTGAGTAAAARAPDVKIKISGCPNGCGQHHIAGIGLQGSIRKIAGRAAPQYFVAVGGGVGPDGATFGRVAGKIPARRLPLAVDRLVELYERERTTGETASAFFARVDVAVARAALADLERLDPADARPEDFIDPGEDRAFAPEIQDGECSA